MSKKIQISPESLPCGGIELKIEVTDTALLGKDSTLTIGKEVFVKDSRPVHKNKKFKTIDFQVSRSQKIKISKETLQSTDGSFPYSGSKIKIQTFAEVKVKNGIIFNLTKRISISDHLSSSLPKRARVKNNAKELIDPKDTFNFFKNFNAIPSENQLLTFFITCFGTVSFLFNLYVGYHDQMVPEHETWFYSHYDSDGDGSSPLVKALGICSSIAFFTWLGIKKQLKKYMAFHFKAKIRKVSRESTVNVSKLITGQSRIDLIDSVLRVVACNMEKGQYVRGYGSNRRTISFSHPNRAVLLYSKKIPIIPAGTPIHQYFDEEISFKPMFQSLYPRQMVTDKHGLDLVWEVQLIVDDLIDQELIGNPNVFIQKEFYSA
tara:strand:- start:313 stop:1440 length:1128 start_codon:yes stop_codon:yes gene_type:complete